jgi:phosphoesterase RecJ-like protein
VFFVDEPNQIRVRLRSKGPVINQLAMKYNGGGHPMASGATVYSEEETKQVVSDLVELCKEFVTGR